MKVITVCNVVVAFVAVSVASADGVRYDSPVYTFLRAQGRHPAIPTISGCGYIAVCVTI